MTLVPRFLQVWISGAIIATAVLLGTVQAAIDGHVVGPFAAIVIGVLISPPMLRGARTGEMRARVAWTISALGAAVPVLATLQLDSAEATYLSVSWYTCGVLAAAMLVWMARRPAAATAGVLALVVQTLVWAGPGGFVRLGLAAEVLLLGAMLLIYRTIRLVGEAAEEATARERLLSLSHARQEAFQQERRRRLQAARLAALPLLQRIIDTGCILDERTTTECRILEQTIRDGIRGRHLLNDAMRTAVIAHRRRGATVHVLDDGGLEDTDPHVLDSTLDDVAARLRPLRSDTIVIRAVSGGAPAAITVVATTADPLTAGLERDDQVDLFVSIPRSALRTPSAQDHLSRVSGAGGDAEPAWA